jgi:hypothetical protein
MAKRLGLGLCRFVLDFRGWCLEHITKSPAHVQEFELPGLDFVDVGIGVVGL